MNNETLIPFIINEENDILISAKDLYNYINEEKSFAIWFEEVKNQGFQENIDFIKIYERNSENKINTDYMIKTSMAKYINNMSKDKSSEERVVSNKIMEDDISENTQMNYKPSINIRPTKNMFNIEEIKRDMPKSINTMSINYENTNRANNYENNINNIKGRNNEKTTEAFTNFRDTAKIIGVRENMLVNWLILNNFCYRDSKGVIKPYASAMDYFSMRTYTTENGHFGTQTLINDKGRELFKNMLKNENVI